MAQEKHKKEHIREVIYRLVDLFALLAVAILICALFDRQLMTFTSDLEKIFDNWNTWVYVAVAVMFTAVLWYVLIRLGGACFSGFFSNPPVWIVGIISFIFYYLFKSYLFKGGEDYKTDVMIITIVIFTIVGIIIQRANLILCGDIEGKRSRKAETDLDINEPNFEEISKDFYKLVEWIERDEPINRCSEDRLGRASFARRILKVLGGKPLKTIGLVGPYGCGKSSILNMVKDYVEHPNKENNNNKTVESEVLYPSNRIILCFVSGWGFSEGTSAEHILQAAIKELSKHTDCVGLRNLPGHYRRAMADSGSVLAKILAALLGAWESPLDVLRKLDAVLCRIGKRLVIVLEDIDRNKRKDMFYDEILSLLEGLKGLYNVSFILAIGQESQVPEHQAIEVLIKASEHIEVVPSLPRTSVIKVCETFRTPCLRMLDDRVKCVPDEDRDKRIGMRSYFLKGIFPYIDELAKNTIDYIAALLNNPRVLKLAFRRTWQAWKTLCGEIDFDDLFMCNVLRAAAPEVFIFVNQNINVLRSFAPVPESEGGNKRNEKNRDELQSELKEATKGVRYDSEAAQKLIDAMFPSWADPAQSRYPSMREPFRRYQYVENDEPTDYWDRLNAEEIPEDEVRDQEILFALDEWNKDWQRKVFRDKNMRDALISGQEVFYKSRQFKERINEDTLRELAQEQFQITLEKEKNKSSCENCPAVGEWFLLRHEPTSLDNQVWRDWFFEQIKMILPVSLGYTNDVYAFWVEPKRYSPLELRSKIVEEAKRVYGNNPEALVKALNPNRFSVCSFAKYFSEVDQGGAGFKPEEWKWLGETLLKAGERNMELIIPEISILLGDIKPIPKSKKELDYNCKFLEDLAHKLFGKKFNQLMGLLAKSIDVSMYDTQVKAFIACSQSYARKWISDQGDGIV